MNTSTDNGCETHLRRKAASFDLRLIKCRSRDPDAVDYGLCAPIAPRIRGAVNRALIGRYVCSWTLNVERYLSNTSNLLTHSLEAQAESKQTARVIDGAALVAIETELRRRKRAAQQTRRGGIPTIVNENAVAR